MQNIGAAAMPVIIGIIVLFGFVKDVDVFDSFVFGAKDGIASSIKILPTLIGLVMAVSMVRASGLLELLCTLAEPLTRAANVSPEIAPLALLRPVSGSGSSAYTLSVLQKLGADSETGKIASVLSASTETTFYAIAVYFGACGYKRLKYTVPAALLGDAVTVIISVLTVKLLS